jgi:ABC-type transport system substrate-binding protein
MIDMMAKDARDCGMDLRSMPADFREILDMLDRYPHAIPGTDRPFDLYVGGSTTSPDPGSLTSYASWHATTAKHPSGVGHGNLAGLADPVVDGLVRAGMSTYDQAERARIYRNLQRAVAARVPVLFLWGANRTDLVRSVVAAVDGPLDLDATNWAWCPERMVLEGGP